MRTRTCGQAPIAILFWIVGIGLFSLPFLRSPDGMDPEGDDPGRTVSETDIPFAEDALKWEAELRAGASGLVTGLRGAPGAHGSAGCCEHAPTALSSSFTPAAISDLSSP